MVLIVWLLVNLRCGLWFGPFSACAFLDFVCCSYILALELFGL